MDTEYLESERRKMFNITEETAEVRAGEGGGGRGVCVCVCERESIRFHL